jgi:hypothetical protein
MGAFHSNPSTLTAVSNQTQSDDTSSKLIKILPITSSGPHPQTMMLWTRFHVDGSTALVYTAHTHSREPANVSPEYSPRTMSRRTP